MEKIILHLDMDAFFASVEQRDNPALRGKPVAVVGSKSRTVVVTSSYEARALGVRTGMNKFQAKKACPQIIFVEASHEKYTAICSQIVDILYSFSPDVEVSSIDESFVDITGTSSLFGSPLEIGKKIKINILKELGLSCSVGIGPNRLIAKLASSHDKPDGLLWIKKERVGETLKDLPVEELCGIGKSTKQALNSMGIYTCSQLALAPPRILKAKFGVIASTLINMGKGEDDSFVTPFGYQEQAKSIGHSMTFESDITAPGDISMRILQLADMVSRRMRREKLSGNIITIVIRYNDFHTFTRQKKIQEQTDDAQKIYMSASAIIGKIKLEKPVRLLGVSASGLVKKQKELYLFEQDSKRDNINKALDAVSARFGQQALTFAALKSGQKLDKVISPAWRPFGARKY
ncbi:MAG: DNA polymerase IV [Candidatus Omnitrophica bacterium CG_4_9_14_0_2_um_filter_43_12]|nr:MAG: DNA polymerase IV [Candidatus Omnitrophica bacterium CG03_land_8_20_14_0_80_43_22]PJC46725.1 MAG: DNA polymerase IV [Candidatus Omnitrophica bacterium CG_4_9_14_0_2_um_filter_43_12]